VTKFGRDDKVADGRTEIRIWSTR